MLLQIIPSTVIDSASSDILHFIETTNVEKLEENRPELAESHRF